MAVKNSIQKTAPTFSNFLTSPMVKAKINEVIGGKDGQRFMSAIISAVSVNPALQDCEHGTILSSALLGEALKLSPSPQLGQYYIVPFKDNKNNRTVATFQLGFKGYIQLALRSGNYKDIDVIEIKEGEYLGRDANLGKPMFKFITDDVIREELPTIGYMAYFELTNGFTKKMFWTKNKMEAHAVKYSPAYANDIKKKWNYSFWTKDFDAMAFKTMIRQLISKWGIMSIDMISAFDSDQDVVLENTDYVGANDQPVEDAADVLFQDVEVVEDGQPKED